MTFISPSKKTVHWTQLNRYTKKREKVLIQIQIPLSQDHSDLVQVFICQQGTTFAGVLFILLCLLFFFSYFLFVLQWLKVKTHSVKYYLINLYDNEIIFSVMRSKICTTLLNRPPPCDWQETESKYSTRSREQREKGGSEEEHQQLVLER